MSEWKEKVITRRNNKAKQLIQIQNKMEKLELARKRVLLSLVQDTSLLENGPKEPNLKKEEPTPDEVEQVIKQSLAFTRKSDQEKQ